MNRIKADINPAEFTTKDKVCRVVVSNRTFRLKGMKPWIAFYYEQQGPIIGGSCHKYHFCRDKQVFVKTKHIFCRNKSFVATIICLSRQAYSCCDKRRVLSRQNLYLWQLPPLIGT